jgi:ADP-ribose pyrophosphatase YjhB (NUDIX family)
MLKREWPLTKRWAPIGPHDSSWMIHVPKAGLCLSAFVVIRKANSILLGRPHAHTAWPEMGGFPMRHAAAIKKDGSWLLPATHLLMEEAPDHAARRIANQWAGVRGRPKFVMVQSHLRPSKQAIQINVLKYVIMYTPA